MRRGHGYRYGYNNSSNLITAFLAAIMFRGFISSCLVFIFLSCSFSIILVPIFSLLISALVIILINLLRIIKVEKSTFFIYFKKKQKFAFITKMYTYINSYHVIIRKESRVQHEFIKRT